jgi:hypothetical protein
MATLPPRSQALHLRFILFTQSRKHLLLHHASEQLFNNLLIAAISLDVFFMVSFFKDGLCRTNPKTIAVKLKSGGISLMTSE